MIELFSYSDGSRNDMSLWLEQNCTKPDWQCYWTNLINYIPDNLFCNRSIALWEFESTELALMFKLMFSEHLFNSPQELYQGMLQKRKMGVPV
jgi:hypothetical protein